MFPINSSQTPRTNRKDFPREHIATDESLTMELQVNNEKGNN